MSAFLLALLLLPFAVQGEAQTLEDEYNRLVEPTRENPRKEAHTNTHQRERIRKDLFIEEEGERKQVRLTADESDVQAVYGKGQKAEIVEKLQAVVCVMQEELAYEQLDCGKKPVQVVCVLQAEEGAYHYHSRRFQARGVKIFRYLVEGHQLTDSFEGHTPITTGVARSVDVTFGKQMVLEAHRVKATVGVDL